MIGLILATSIIASLLATKGQKAEALAEAHPEALGGTSDVRPREAEPVEVPRSSEDRGDPR